MQDLYDWLSETSKVHRPRTKHVVAFQHGNIHFTVRADVIGRTAWQQLQLRKCTQRIVDFVERRTTHHDRRVRTTIDVYLCPGIYNKPKTFPRARILDKQHINSGMCTTYNDSKKSIYVFRNSEIRKVYIHEMLHALGVHPMTTDPVLARCQDLLLTHLTNKYPYLRGFQTNITFSEAIVEALACSLEHTFNSNTWEDELKHSHALAARLRAWIQLRLASGGATCTSHALEYLVFKHELMRWRHEWLPGVTFPLDTRQMCNMVNIVYAHV